MDYSVVTELIFAYARGEFGRKGVISERRDDLDMLIAGINMLGEELEATTISRDYFSSLYDAVTDMIIVVDNNGLIEDVNPAFIEKSKMNLEGVRGRAIDKYIQLDKGAFFDLLGRSFKKSSTVVHFEAALKLSSHNSIPVKLRASQIYRKPDLKSGYLLALEDIREKLEKESLVLRTIVETQEAERRRVAGDLHDSLGQKLSAVKLYLNALGSSPDATQSLKGSLKEAKKIVDESIHDLRNIVFDQMPITLERFGLKEALQELVKRLDLPNITKIHLEIESELPSIPKNLEVVIFRITQEFIQNSIKHAQASNMFIDIWMRRAGLVLHLEDDGIGFDAALMDMAKGHGLMNMVTRIRAFNGKHTLKTSAGQGVKLSIVFNLAKN